MLAGAVQRKSGDGQKDFFKVTLKEVFVNRAGFDTEGGSPLGTRIRTVIGELVDEVQYYDHHVDALIRYVTQDDAGAVSGRFAQYLGMTYTSALATDASLALTLDVQGGNLDVLASLTDAPGRFTLRTHPVPEPGSAALVLLALSGLPRARLRLFQRTSFKLQ